MAVQNASSDILSTLDATPPISRNVSPYLYKGVSREVIGSLALTATQAGGDAGSVWRIVRVPSRARISQIWLLSDALDAGTGGALKVNLGFYNTSAKGGAAVDANVLLSENALLRAAVGLMAEIYGSFGSAVQEQRVWEVCGLSSDPSADLDLAFTVSTAAAAAAAGGVLLKVVFVDDF